MTKNPHDGHLAYQPIPARLTIPEAVALTLEIWRRTGLPIPVGVKVPR